MARRLPWRRVKIHRSYEFREAAALLGVHVNTVRHWVRRDGLLVLAEARPFLILGAELRGFLAARQASTRRSLGPREMFCLGCRAPRTPDPALVEDASPPAGPGMVRGICPVCAAIMNRRVARARLPDFLGPGASAAGRGADH